MKSKLVLWGKNPEEQKVLLALSLQEDEKKVSIYVFPEEVITVELENQLHKDWKAGDEVNFPAEAKKFEKELSLVNDLLPEGFSAERDDLVKRAQTEWHFVILSSKLFQTYVSEVEEIKDRIEALESYQPNLWEELKGFWDKVQSQIVEKNLLRDHANELREHTNNLFSRLKELRKEVDKMFNEESKSNFESFAESLKDIEERISNGLSLHVIFEDLKSLQKKFKNLKLSKDHRNKLWSRLDSAFKEVKEKRFGDSPNKETSPLARLEKRLKGLNEAINKMERSIKRDKQERSQQEKGTASAFGQLELQLREAKMTMIDERISSKETKLNDMLKTRKELETRQVGLQARADKEKELEEAKKLAEAKIAAEIKEAAESRKEEDAKLEKLAAEIVEKKEPKAPAPKASDKIAKEEPKASDTTVEVAAESTPEPSQEEPVGSDTTVEADVESNNEPPKEAEAKAETSKEPAKKEPTTASDEKAAEEEE